MRTFYLLLAMIAILLVSCDKNNDSDIPGAGDLTQVFIDSTYQLTGVAVSKEGRLFTNYPLWSDIHKYSLVEVLPGNQVKPYPNEAMNNWQPGESGMDKWVCVQAVYIDDNNTMWVVDPASPKMQGVYQNSHKLVKINLQTNAVERTYSFANVADAKSYINDVRVDTDAQYAYLTNSSEGGIVVVNLTTGTARQVLQEHYSVHTDSSYTFEVDGRELMKNGAPFKTQSDGIALTPDRKYLYYKPLTDNKLYRIATAWLRNDTASAATLAAKVESVGAFTTTDGMIFDKSNNLYLGDIERYRMVRISPDLQMTPLFSDERLIWPDSYSLSADNYLYISCSQIQKQPEYNNGVNKRTTPYAIYKLKL